jgi:hypothetical protein
MECEARVVIEVQGGHRNVVFEMLAAESYTPAVAEG